MERYGVHGDASARGWMVAVRARTVGRQGACLDWNFSGSPVPGSRSLGVDVMSCFRPMDCRAPQKPVRGRSCTGQASITS